MIEFAIVLFVAGGIVGAAAFKTIEDIYFEQEITRAQAEAEEIMAWERHVRKQKEGRGDGPKDGDPT